jgi:hypothetical protein
MENGMITCLMEKEHKFLQMQIDFKANFEKVKKLKEYINGQKVKTLYNSMVLLKIACLSKEN